MRITQSALGMESSYSSLRVERERLEIKRTPPPEPPPPPQVETPKCKGLDEELSRDFKTYLLKLVVEWLSGEKITEVDDPEMEAPEQPAAQRRPEVELHYERVRYEAEKVDFHAQGVVTTGDGRQIALDLRVGMQREHYERQTLDVGGPKAQDPLVLNFQAATTSLGGKKISFDLDLDGAKDQVALPTNGSRFLALDRNGNGKFDDGSELFGAKTGDGFAELALLDDDGDGWIDEDDAAFEQLRVWDGENSALSLREAGVGAINVGSVKTPFTLGGSDATATGLIRSTGVWLAEDTGQAHTVQQIDIVI